MIKKITREEEAAFPHFGNHAEARIWFKEKYGDAFELVSVEGEGGNRCYRYYLVLDRETFEEGQNVLQAGSMSGPLAMRFLHSHQPVEITEDGSVHVVY